MRAARVRDRRWTVWTDTKSLTQAVARLSGCGARPLPAYISYLGRVLADFTAEPDDNDTYWQAIQNIEQHSVYGVDRPEMVMDIPHARVLQIASGLRNCWA